MTRLLNHWLFAVLVPALVGLGFVVLCVSRLELYGWSLFLGLPVLVSFLAAFCWSFRRRVTFASAYGMAIYSLMTVGIAILVFALDGLICLLMALPLAAVLGLIGAILGQIAGEAFGKRARVAAAVLLPLLFPGLVAFEHSRREPAPLRSVTTRVVIEAPIEEVWDTVIAFPEIETPPRGIFRWGIAYPIGARIEGEGVGAVRHCRFSTGDFVEPITTWDAPRHLAFDVVENPPPMRELSPHGDLDVPHLHGHLVSERGEFRLTPRDGRVDLQGTTWYRHSLQPRFYWGPVSDAIIHRIHRRVLDHIRTTAESGS